MKHLKEIAKMKIFENNTVLRLHYRAESDSISLNSSAPHATKANVNMECMFCYSTAPKLSVFNGFKCLRKSNRRLYKKVNVICRVCNKKYPSKYTSKLNIKEKVKSNKDASQIVEHSKDRLNQKDFPKPDLNANKKKQKKKRKREQNAGLILPSAATTNSLNLNVGSKCEEKLDKKRSGKNDKILKHLLQKAQPNEGCKKSYSSKLELFLNSA